MLTAEQYDAIMLKKAMPIVNKCLTQRDNPNAATYGGLTNSTQRSHFSFDKTIVAQCREQIIDIYRDLPRRFSPAAPYGFVAFTDFFTNNKNPKRIQAELKLANAFINLSDCADIVLSIPLRNDNNDLLGANAMLRFNIPANLIVKK